jgi:ERCC4-type nuclease
MATKKEKKEIVNDMTIPLKKAYSKKDWDLIFSNITIIIDTDEKAKKNDHIKDVFHQSGVKHMSKKLNYADYSFVLDEIPSLGIPYIDFTNKFCIERKNGIDELSINFCHKRKQFENEFERAEKDRARILLMIENNTYEDILLHKYISDFPVASYTASLMTFQVRYKMSFIFVSSISSANFIYNSFKYYLREYLTN